VPLMVPLVMAMVFGPLLAWKRGNLGNAAARLWLALAASVFALVYVLFLYGFTSVLSAFGMALAAWVSLGALVELAERIRLFRLPFADSWSRAASLPRSAWGMTIAHFGLGVFIAGAVASSSWQVEKVQIVHPGDAIEVAGYSFLFKGAVEENGPNYVARRGTFEVTKNGRPVATLHPAKRFFPVQRTTTTEAAIHTLWIADLYAVIGDPQESQQMSGAPFPTDPKAGWAARLYYNPLIPWIWFGAIVMALGGVVSLTDRRHRIGAPVPARSTTAASPAE
jgi:cytochrome c-type biogenesis protein CcmF